MKRGLLLLLAGLSLSGCITERRLAFTSPAGPLAPPGELSSAPLERRWALGEVVVTPEQGGNPQLFDDWRKGRSQFEARLRETLSRQPNLGTRVDDRATADLIVDVDVRLRESRAVNGWMTPAILSELVVMGAVCASGALIGSAVSSNKQEGALLGSTIALVPATALGIAVPLAFPTNQVIASADAKLVFRRASDGVVILEKHARSEWESSFNNYGVEERLAKLTGEGAQSLERELVSALYVGLRSAPPTPSTGLSERTFPLDAPVSDGHFATAGFTRVGVDGE